MGHVRTATVDSASSTAATLRDYLELGKPRLSTLVLVTTLVGYLLGAAGGWSWPHLAITLLGTALAAFGANALNEWIETDIDARMRRTCERPLPAQRVPGGSALVVALATAFCGPLLLASTINVLAGFLAAATVAIYVLAYTPMKTRTPLSTLVGAVVGAIPPMIGWAAATGRLDLAAWVLGAILFLWQIPHALALAWMYREDYERAGIRLLPSIDPGGQLTCRVIMVHTLMLLPLGLTMTLVDITGPIYAIGSLILGGWLIGRVVHLMRRGGEHSASRVFLATVMYLPLLLGLMLLDQGSIRQPPGSAPGEIVSVRSAQPLANAQPSTLPETRRP
ncbi:MAG: protoheme IX farnesyltransferase [Phycisphaerae bacterium]|nr:protoheme IX farnesyltransferase [Phycisphaerae bacterium]